MKRLFFGSLIALACASVWGARLGSLSSNDSVATPSDVEAVSDRVTSIEGYLGGARVRISVTNYYGNTSGDVPTLRIEEWATTTNEVDGARVATNYWRIVWNEADKHEETKGSIASMTNGLARWAYNLVMAESAMKAPRAWGRLTSAGEAAPPNMVWHTEPQTVFAGGTEYAHAVCGSGVISVLKNKGAAVYTEGANGRFYFQNDSGSSYFGMNIQESYDIGCATDGIKVTNVDGDNIVELTYNITSSSKPIIYYTPTLQPAAWEQLTDASGSPIAGASTYASWEGSPPEGAEICYLNCGAGASGFFKAAIQFSGSNKFETNMAADLGGGILATNLTTNQIQPVEPYIENGEVKWKLK